MSENFEILSAVAAKDKNEPRMHHCNVRSTPVTFQKETCAAVPD